MTSTSRGASRRAYVAIAAAMLLGLGLRVATARGGLWLDEAWSASFVAQVGDPIGVLWRINHDNNHFLNSWWMLVVGPYAPPMLVRGLSIATGVAAIAVAGVIGLRRNVGTGIVAALMFAVSPILVAYGAEARGYAPMVLAFLLSILTVDRWLDGDRPAPASPLAVLTLLGMLAQFTYIFALAAIGGWIVVALARRMSIDAAVRSTVRALLPSFGAVVLVIAIVAAASNASSAGFQVGDYRPFSSAVFSSAMSEAIVYTIGLSLGLPLVTIAATLLAVTAAIRFTPGAVHRRFLYAFAVLAFPAVLAMGHVGNTGFARYLLVACAVLLLLIAEMAGIAWARGGWRRVAATGSVILVLVVSLSRDVALADALRGDPAQAIAAMHAAAPTGTSVGVDRSRSTAVLDAAARTAGYPLTIQEECNASVPPPAFVHVDLAERKTVSPNLHRCGQDYRRIALGRHLALSGLDWALYARTSARGTIISAH